jgi:hypothetical protein
MSPGAQGADGGAYSMIPLCHHSIAKPGKTGKCKKALILKL